MQIRRYAVQETEEHSQHSKEPTESDVFLKYEVKESIIYRKQLLRTMVNYTAALEEMNAVAQQMVSTLNQVSKCRIASSAKSAAIRDCASGYGTVCDERSRMINLMRNEVLGPLTKEIDRFELLIDKEEKEYYKTARKIVEDISTLEKKCGKLASKNPNDLKYATCLSQLTQKTLHLSRMKAAYLDLIQNEERNNFSFLLQKFSFFYKSEFKVCKTEIQGYEECFERLMQAAYSMTTDGEDIPLPKELMDQFLNMDNKTPAQEISISVNSSGEGRNRHSVMVRNSEHDFQTLMKQRRCSVITPLNEKSNTLSVREKTKTKAAPPPPPNAGKMHDLKSSSLKTMHSSSSSSSLERLHTQMESNFSVTDLSNTDSVESNEEIVQVVVPEVHAVVPPPPPPVVNLNEVKVQSHSNPQKKQPLTLAEQLKAASLARSSRVGGNSGFNGINTGSNIGSSNSDSNSDSNSRSNIGSSIVNTPEIVEKVEKVNTLQNTVDSIEFSLQSAFDEIDQILNLNNDFEVRALHDFDSRNEEELSLRIGDVLLVSKEEAEWYYGALNNREGWFPKTFVERL